MRDFALALFLLGADISFSLSYSPAMPEYISPSEFLRLRDDGLPLIDVRSPSEYAYAHIPGACNLPLLSDDERAAVGTAHAKSGSEAALHTALELIGPQLAAKLARVRQLYQSHLRGMKEAHRRQKEKNILLHCWRGGMRSKALAWLMETGGFSVRIMQGGYKAYRAFVRSELAKPVNTLVLSGMTGSGKTDVLRELAALGSQVVDLEGLASHRGSAFGAIGMDAQPCNEHMENVLFEQWRLLDPAKPIWLEDEDRRIGTVSLCGELFDHIRTGRVVQLDVPLEGRISRLVRLYTGPEFKTALMDCVERIRPRLGDERAGCCVEAIRDDRFEDAVRGILFFYDKLYARQMDKHGRTRVLLLQMPEDNPRKAAEMLRRKELAGDFSLPGGGGESSA